MHIIPLTIVDNFFDDPDSIRKWALTLPYSKDPRGRWPGERSPFLHDINPEFVDYFSKKYFSLFFNFELEPINWVMDACFQRIDKDYGQGWIHQDESVRMAGLIYLTPGADLRSGTSIYARSNEAMFAKNKEQSLLAKVSFYNTGRPSLEELEPYRKNIASEFTETVRINNVYNRLVSYDGHLHHSANEFLAEKENTRLTLVFFVNHLQADKSPIHRMRSIT